MSRYWTEPPFKHDSASRTGVLLVNLGTPEAPTAAALRPYLKQFLSDPRVVEIPRLVWWPILNGIILNTRPAASAKKYASVWTDEGSPLKVHTQRQAKLLAGYLAKAGHDGLDIDYAMRYGAPSIPDVLEAMRTRGCTRILVLPLYPQYSASTSATVVDEVGRCLAHWRNQPEMRFVRNFHDHPGYIAALVRSVREHWTANGEPERLLLSFHGVPRRSLELGDPYHCECHKTGRLVAEELGIARERVLVTFQSRFGKAEWLKPYTQPTLESLAQQGIRRVDVMCPGFVSDCLCLLYTSDAADQEDKVDLGGR
ncbi:MAG TPA: ferrochelatase, partial [Thauera sp.]|nr:ferrochelatase [Thauera sp.]